MNVALIFLCWSVFAFLFSFFANLSLLITVVFSLALTVLLFFCFACFNYSFGFVSGERPVIFAWQLASVYVIFEMLKDRIAGGLSWGNLSQLIAFLYPVNQILATVGPYGVSWLIVFASILTIFAINYKNYRLALLSLVVCSVVFLWGVLSMVIYKPIKSPLSLALMQPAISGLEKIEVKNADSIWHNYIKLAKEFNLSKERIDLLVLPETMAIYTWPDLNLKVFVRELLDVSKANVLVLGAVLYQRGHFYNSAVWIDKKRTIKFYAKKKLVPFGEYLPFAERGFRYFLKFLGIESFVGFSAGKKDVVFNFNGFKLLPLICYEDSFSYFVRDRIKKAKEVNALIVLTNDCWFGKSFAQWFHLANSVMRAIEFNVPVIRVNNDGFSCIISPCGKIIAGDVSLEDLGKSKVVLGLVEYYRLSPTLYYRLGNSLVMFNLLLCGIISGYIRLKSRRWLWS